MSDYIYRRITKRVGDTIHHRFYDKRDNHITDKKFIRDCCEGIYIPPAYDDVKIFTKKNRKIRAIGYDTKDRPQYIYNKEYISQQSDKKFNHMSVFGKKFSRINQKITEDMLSVKDSKDKQTALILKLIMECHFRVGSERYLKDNKSYGTTTLENKHLTIKKDMATIDFIGKKKVRNQCTIRNKRIVKTLKEKKRMSGRNDKLFMYRVGERYHTIKSSDVNKYLKQFGNFTTKNFRTWGANIELIIQLLRQSKDCPVDTAKRIKSILKKSIEKVAHKLHNTPGVCRSNYLDPELIQFFTNDCKGFLSYFYTSTKQTYSKDDISKKYVYFLEGES
jgi:DNA topoisomerase-1